MNIYKYININMKKTIKLKGGSRPLKKIKTPSKWTLNAAKALTKSNTILPEQINALKQFHTSVTNSLAYKTQKQQIINQAALKLKQNKSTFSPVKRLFAKISSYFKKTKTQRDRNITSLDDAAKLIKAKLNEHT